MSKPVPTNPSSACSPRGIPASDALLAALEGLPLPRPVRRRNGTAHKPAGGGAADAGPADAVFQTVVADELRQVETALQAVMASDVDLLASAGRYVIESGGKRMRPRILLLAHRALSWRDALPATPAAAVRAAAAAAGAVRAAAAIELLHVASLIHDDINDHSDMRRGRASVNKRWGADLALLIGDFVFVPLLKLLAGLDARAVDVLADACAAVVEGETAQMLQLGDTTIGKEDVSGWSRAETAALFAAAAEHGGHPRRRGYLGGRRRRVG